ncbi:uncharacterized protein LOC100381585 [Zea mays]|uniref:uncharacterized protein LOC100381585 n=1 Tax=Zea mays TaxID=4577 RepID=UPI0002207D18|nr:uncharacterized protein LOC100381585 [Zea mays]|eukprot:NP_001343557.1 uncharacterized protein LOC100381585 [Zea mays]
MDCQVIGLLAKKKNNPLVLLLSSTSPAWSLSLNPTNSLCSVNPTISCVVINISFCHPPDVRAAAPSRRVASPALAAGSLAPPQHWATPPALGLGLEVVDPAPPSPAGARPPASGDDLSAPPPPGTGPLAATVVPAAPPMPRPGSPVGGSEPEKPPAPGILPTMRSPPQSGRSWTEETRARSRVPSSSSACAT